MISDLQTRTSLHLDTNVDCVSVIPYLSPGSSRTLRLHCEKSLPALAPKSSPPDFRFVGGSTRPSMSRSGVSSLFRSAACISAEKSTAGGGAFRLTGGRDVAGADEDEEEDGFLVSVGA